MGSLIERYKPALLQRFGSTLSRDRHHALRAMVGCRTERYGKMVIHCDNCQLDSSCYHSCGHRSCPTCQNHETTVWLQRQQQKLLPVDYFMATFTLLFELRFLTRCNQKEVYSTLFSCAVETLKQFGLNDKKLGAAMGMTAVLHTHSRRLDYHPHLHVVIPGGCLDKKRKQWKKMEGKYLFNSFALASVFRAKMIMAIKKLKLVVPSNTLKKWFVDCQHVGRGKHVVVN